MELAQLSARAMQIRECFARYEQRRTGRTWTREEIAQGFVVDVGDLMKLVMAKAGARRVAGDVDAQLAHELSDCLWSVLVLAKLYGVDLEREFLRTMDELECGTDAKTDADY
ncbi:MAG: nucleotide pyrophosphohydrolase [Opitutus sp.]|nr:nucleotide pyrophosphohydrolase [Opitutus sp.]